MLQWLLFTIIFLLVSFVSKNVRSCLRREASKTVNLLSKNSRYSCRTGSILGFFKDSIYSEKDSWSNFYDNRIPTGYVYSHIFYSVKIFFSNIMIFLIVLIDCCCMLGILSNMLI